MLNDDELFDVLLSALNVAKNALNHDRRKLEEVIDRLIALKSKFEACLELNETHLDHSASLGGRLRFDAERSALVVEIDGQVIEIHKIERKVTGEPAQVKELFFAAGFSPGASDQNLGKNEAHKSVERELAIEVESFYDSAARWWKDFEKVIVRRGKPEFIGVMMVRNKLIAHADKTFEGTENGYLNTFASSSSCGPIIKPQRYLDQTNDFQDAGLRANVRQMLNVALKRLEAS